MLECRECGAIIRESELVHISVQDRNSQFYPGGYVCPECLQKMLAEDALRELDDDEEREMRSEWDSDDEYRRLRELGAV